MLCMKHINESMEVGQIACAVLIWTDYPLREDYVRILLREGEIEYNREILSDMGYKLRKQCHSWRTQIPHPSKTSIVLLTAQESGLGFRIRGMRVKLERANNFQPL